MIKNNIFLNVILFTFIFLLFVTNSYAYTDYFIKDYDRLPFKWQKSNATWSEYINDNYNPADGDWLEEDDTYGLKCLSYGASTVNDWYAILNGIPLLPFQDFMNNQTEIGTNPRELESIYYSRLTGMISGNYNYVPRNFKTDFTTNETIIHGLKGYLDLLINPPLNWSDVQDSNLGSNYLHTVLSSNYLQGYNYVPISTNEESFKSNFKRYGVIYARMQGSDNSSWLNYLLQKVGDHTVALVGYRDYGTSIDLWVHDSVFNNASKDLKLINPDNITEAYILYDPQWSTSHHNNRRTGFTTLKGDLSDSTYELVWSFDADVDLDFWDEIRIADIDGDLDNGHEVIVATSSYNLSKGRIYAADGSSGDELWSYSDSGSLEVNRNPVVKDIDRDGKKELVFSTNHYVPGYWFGYNGSKIYVLDIDENGASLKCTFETDDFVYNETNSYKTMPLGIAIEDTDFDGDQDIIVVDFLSTYLYSGTMYSLDENCSRNWNVSLGSFGSQENPVLADIDGDKKLEIVVVEGSNLSAFNAEDGSKIWSYAHQLLNGSQATVYADPVVADVDVDGSYDIITVASFVANTSLTKWLLVHNNEGIINWQKQLDHGVAGTPAVANLDDDNALEIVVATAYPLGYINGIPNASIGEGTIYVFDGSSHNQEWNYTPGGKVRVSPVIADIDSDDELEIIFTANDGLLYVLSSDGSLKWSRDLNSYPIDSPAIGDIDGDLMAEIVIKHAHGVGEDANDEYGFPDDFMLNYDGLFPSGHVFEQTKKKNSQLELSLLSESTEGGETSTLEAIGGMNHKPVLNNLSNITVNESDLINLNLSGEITATDEDNNSLFFYYDYLFNETGFWQTDCDSAGTYPVLIEVSDGNLSDWQYIYITINEYCNDTFIIENASSDKAIWFTSTGDLFISGLVEENSVYEGVSDDLFVFRHSGTDVFFVANNGSLYLNGVILENQASLYPSGTSNYFAIKTEGNVVAYINETGSLFLKGEIK